MADDLDQLQPRHRIEEVQSDEPLRRFQRGAQVLQRNARCVGREDRARLHFRLQPGIDLLLQFQLFRHRLDDQVGIAHAFAVEIGNEPVQRVTDVGGFAHDLAEQVRCPLHRAGNRLRLHVAERDPQAQIGAPCRDVAAHRAGADDVNMVDLVAGACEFFHLLAQEKYPDQVLRRRRHHQIGERGLFGGQHRSLVAAVLFPEIDQRVRRWIMLMGSGLLSLGAHPRAQKASDRTGIQNAVQQTGVSAFQTAEQRVLDGIADMPLLRHAIDKPERLRTTRVDGFAGQHQRHRLHRIDQTCEPRGAAEARMQAQHHFRKTEARPVDRNTRLTGQRDFEAAAEAEAVDHGDGRNLQAFEAVDHRVRSADTSLNGTGIGRAAEFVDVRTGNEAGFLRRANDKSRGPLVFQRREHGVEFLDDVG